MIAGKVWGKTRLLQATPLVEVHEITVHPNARCSRHHHVARSNAFYCTQGQLNIYVEKSYGLVDVTRLLPGDYTVVPPGDVHWFQTGVLPTRALEIYAPEPLGAPDIVRKDRGRLLRSKP